MSSPPETWSLRQVYDCRTNGTGFVPATGPNNVALPQPSATLGDSYGMPGGIFMESRSVWLIMQADDNLVLYRKRDNAVLWSSGTWGQPGTSAAMQSGDLMIFSPGRTMWETRTYYFPGANLKVQDDANVVVYRQGRSDPAGALWSTGTWGRG